MKRWRWNWTIAPRVGLTGITVGALTWCALITRSELIAFGGVLLAVVSLLQARVRSEKVREKQGALMTLAHIIAGGLLVTSPNPQLTWWVGGLIAIGSAWWGASRLWKGMGLVVGLGALGLPATEPAGWLEYALRALLIAGSVGIFSLHSAQPKPEQETPSGFEPVPVDNLPHSRFLTQRLSVYLQQHLSQLGGEGAILYLYDIQAGALKPVLKLGALPDLVKQRTRVLLGETIVGASAQLGKPLAFLSLLKPPADLPKNVTWEGAPSLCVPLFDPASPSGRPLGVLQLLGTGLTMDCLPKARAIASRLAEAVATVRQREAEQLANFQRLSAIVAQVEEQSPHTRGHSHRVAALCDLLAQELGLESEVREKLQIAALFHDIGKTHIPPEILNKEGALTEEERAIIRRYPHYSVEICSGMGFDDDVLFLIKHHGERLDGSGYPDRLDATRQPLALRILEVADVFDAMACTRAYREALSVEERLRELTKLAGTKLDVLVIETLRRCVLQGRVEPIYNPFASSQPEALLRNAA